MTTNVLACANADRWAVKGSQKRPCHVCGVAVWVAPSGPWEMARYNLKPHCIACATASAQGEEFTLLPLTKAQVRELAREGVDRDDLAVEWLRLRRLFQR